MNFICGESSLFDKITIHLTDITLYTSRYMMLRVPLWQELSDGVDPAFMDNVYLSCSGDDFNSVIGGKASTHTQVELADLLGIPVHINATPSRYIFIVAMRLATNISDYYTAHVDKCTDLPPDVMEKMIPQVKFYPWFYRNTRDDRFLTTG